jgi:hypothetical protein
LLRDLNTNRPFPGSMNRRPKTWALAIICIWGRNSFLLGGLFRSGQAGRVPFRRIACSSLISFGCGRLMPNALADSAL